jgi:PAS domain S-box-containing protein
LNPPDTAENAGRDWASAARDDIRGFAGKVADTVREVLIILDPDLRVLFANRAFYEGFQVDPAETEGRLIYDLGNRQWDIPELRHLLEQVLPHDRQFSGYRMEHRFEHLGPRVMMLNARRLDHVQFIVLAIEDVTDKEGAQASLGETEARYTAIVEEATDYAIFTTDAQNRIETWPPGAQAVFGWTPEEVIGQLIDITFTPEDRAANEPGKEYDQARATGVAPDVRWHQRKDGSRVFIDGSARYRTGPNGGFAGLLKVGRDDTERRRVQEALGESEARFRQFAENSQDLLWIVDAEGERLEYLSPAYEHIFGEPPGAVMADLGRWAELVHPDDRAAAAGGMPRLLAGEVVTQEYRVVRPANGAVCWVRDTGFPIRDETGRVRRVGGIAQDITHRKRAEEALRQSEERLRAIVEEATDYVILTTDANNVIESWMPGAQAVFGWTPEEAIGQPLEITFTPEDRAAGVPEEEFAQAREHGVAPDVRWHQCKDGSRVFIDGSTRTRRGATGAFEGVLKIGRDATARRRFEEALRESEERFRQFADASADVLWIRDAETLTYEYVSPAFERIYGMPGEELMSGNTIKRWAELIVPEDRDAAMKNLRRVRGGEQVTHQFRILRPDGAIRWIEDTDFPLLGLDGQVERIAGIGKDVTEAKQAADRQRLLLAELQHRVRNILTVVRSVASRTGENSPEVEDFLSHFDGRLGTLARTQSAVIRTEDVSVDLEEMVRDELLAVAADEDRIEVSGPTVRLRQRAAENLALAVHELTTNAVKYGALSSRDGRLSVTWDVRKPNGQELLTLHWRESGVRAIDANPKRTGFGRQLIERALPYELGADTSLKFAAGGVRAEIELPLTAENAVLG